MVEMETAIMIAVGLGRHYADKNGSGTCAYLRREALRRLPEEMLKHGLTLSGQYEEALRQADAMDEEAGGEYTLTNVWKTASNAIQDAVYAKVATDPRAYDGADI